MSFTVSKLFSRYELTKTQKCAVGDRIKKRFWNDYKTNPPKIKEGKYMVNHYPDEFFKASLSIFKRFVNQKGLKPKQRLKKK